MTDPESKLNLPVKCYDFCVDSLDIHPDPTNIRVACPDFSILLDHTIGVIWKLMNKDADVKSVDQFHLIWALKFLEGIKPERGHVTKDVELLKLLIRKLIVDAYAGSDVEKPKPLEKTKLETNTKPGPNQNINNNEELILDKAFSLDKSDMRDNGDLNKGFVGDEVSVRPFSLLLFQ